MRRSLFLVLLSMVIVSPVWADVPSYEVQIRTKTLRVNAAVTDSVLWTPAADHSIALLGCHITTEAPNVIEIESANVDVIPRQILESYGSATILGGAFPIWVGSADATLTVTTENASNASVVCWGYEALQ